MFNQFFNSITKMFKTWFPKKKIGTSEEKITRTYIPPQEPVETGLKIRHWYCNNRKNTRGRRVQFIHFTDKDGYFKTRKIIHIV